MKESFDISSKAAGASSPGLAKAGKLGQKGPAAMHEKAAEAFLKGYETSEEKNPEILYYAAASYLSAEKNAKAIPVLERLIAQDASKARDEWKETLAHAYIADGKPQKAIPLMQRLVETFSGEKKMQWQENLLYQYLALDMK